MSGSKGVVAAGHPLTAAAAETVLREGGNAFDAALAAFFAACVTEPVLTSLAGGGFLIAHLPSGRSRVYDFFVQTPRAKRVPADIDFHPIVADFGAVQQEFHIGPGAIATPGVVRGIFEVHRELGSMPLGDIVSPAVELARHGVEVNALQAYIFSVVAPIYQALPESREIYTSRQDPGVLLQEGEWLRIPQYGDILELLAIEGEDLFYRGEIANAIVGLCREAGGHLTMADLEGYRGAKREPLQVDYRDARVLANPPPASGGLLIAFALKVLEPLDTTGWTFGCREHLLSLARAMEVTNKARLYAHLDDSGTPLEAARLLDAAFLERYRLEVQGRPTSTRGTTHISVMDKTGNTAAMTVSNGEGCGHIVPGTGIMLNNMLGEEDLNPQGFHRWQPDQRMTSMMSPSIVVDRGGRRTFALGSGGSNRIRSAILQTLINLIDFDMRVDSAVQSPRLHWENDLLNAEGGFPTGGLRPLLAEYPDHKVWDGFNLFFGGAHVVLREKGAFSGAGDPRRGGVCLVV